MKQKSQALRKDPWSWLKRLLREIRKPLTLKQILMLFGLGVGVVLLYFYSMFNQQKIESEQLKQAEIAREQQLAKEERKRLKAQMEIVIPENPYSFYDQLENRSFYTAGTDLRGGMELSDPEPTPSIPIPQLTLISAPEEEYRTTERLSEMEEADLFAPPPLEFLSISSDGGESEIEQGSSSFDVIVEPIVTVPPKGPPQRNFKRLQTGSFLSLTEANLQRKQLEAYGYNPQILRAQHDDKTIYRVQIGPFALSELPHIKSDLKEKSFDFFEIR